MLTLETVTPLTVALAAAVIVLAAVILLTRHRQSSKATNTEQLFKTLPGPKGLPLIGSSHIIGRYTKHSDAFSALRRKYGDIYGVKLGSRRCCVVSSLPLIKEVLVTKSNDFANRPDFLRFHAIFRGDRNFSIALCDWSEKQKKRREIAFPFMHPRAQTFDGSKMNTYITSELSEFIQTISKLDGQVINPRPHLLFTTANIFFQYLCTKRFSADDENFRNVVRIYDLVFRELFQGFAIDFMPWLKLFNRRRLQELKDLAEEVSSVISPIFEEHEKDLDENKPRDLVNILLGNLEKEKEEGSSSLTREDAEIIIEDLIGGHSVLGNLWLWGLYILADNPEVRKNIREEVSEIVGDSRTPTLEDRPNMPYTEATTMELLRCIASPIIPHVATKDTSIQDYKIAKNTMVMFNTYDINMDTTLWQDPRRFNPERFISPSGRVTKPAHFLPFGTGKRTCLGDGLVKSTLFLGLSTLLQHFDILLPEGMPTPNLYEIPGIVVPQKDILLTFRRLDSPVSTSPCTTINITA